MKIGLNDPNNKSIVLATGLTSDELVSDHSTTKVKLKKKRKTRRNAKSHVRTMNTNNIERLANQIIDEEEYGEEN